MPIDGLFIHHLVNELNILKTGRLNRINQISPTDYIFVIRANSFNYNLFITIHTELAHINLTERFYEVDLNQTNLTILLKKYLEGGIIKDIFQLNNDRIICLEVIKHNEIGDKLNSKLYIELMGRHSNMVLCENDIIISAYKYVNPFESDVRTILPNIKYEIKNDRLNPFNYSLMELKNEFSTILTPKDLSMKFDGVSSFISNYTYDNYELFYKYINTYNPTIYDNQVYFMDMPFINSLKHYDSLSKMLDEYYYSKTKQNEKKVRTSNLIHHVKSKLDKLERKLLNLENDLNDALNSESYRIKGELLFNNISKIKPGDEKIVLYNYYDNSEITIELDKALPPKKNAQKYFTIYNKKKNACKMIPIQIEETKDEIEYLKIIESQIEVGSIDDIIGISNELSPKKQNKKNKIKIATYKTDSYTIYIGKNNEQNAYLTKEMANPCDLWFHVHNMPSSHIILEGLVNEESIRLCSMLAAYYSKARYSSSVEVIYTQVKYLKRVPKKRNCFLTYSNEKTIYIDPDINYIEKLNIK